MKMGEECGPVVRRENDESGKRKRRTAACEMLDVGRGPKCEKAHWPNKAISPETQGRDQVEVDFGTGTSERAQGAQTGRRNRRGSATGGSRPTLPGFVLESLEVLEGFERGGLVEIEIEQGLAEVVVLGGEHLQLGFGRGHPTVAG